MKRYDIDYIFGSDFIGVFYPHSPAGNVESVVINNEISSEIYTQEEIDDAVDEVLKTFEDFNGCVLTELYYSGDAYAENFEFEAEQWGADQAIILLSSFEVVEGGADTGFEEGTMSNWSWILVRENGGEWHCVDWGY